MALVFSPSLNKIQLSISLTIAGAALLHTSQMMRFEKESSFLQFQVSGTSPHVSALQSPVLLLMKIWPRDALTWILGTSGACQSRIRWTTWLGRCGTLFTAHSSTTNSVRRSTPEETYQAHTFVLISEYFAISV